MLVRFNVKNFLSFFERKDPETSKTQSHEFSMLPGKVRLNSNHIYQNKKQNLLKLAAIYGANASGKSNITKAISFFRTMTINGKCPVGSIEKYSKVEPENKDKPSYFECEILLDQDLYSYGFEVILSTGIIESEWLTCITKQSETNLFYKDGKDDDYHFSKEFDAIADLNIYQQGIKGSNSLFLYEMNKNKQGFYSKYSNYPKAQILHSVYKWIKDKLEIVSPNLPVNDTSFLINTESLEKIADLLNSFDTGIVSIKKINEDFEKILERIPSGIKQNILRNIEFFKMKKILGNNYKLYEKWYALIRSRNDILGFELDGNLKPQAYSLQFEHRNINPDIHFRISEESDGTARLFELIEILISKNAKTYIVDELDRCLHPCLTYKFIQNFFEYTKDSKTQLIVTTHESRLLDLKLLRRDEIWFIDKDSSGNSNIYSLDEYNTRFDQKVDKAYLEGRYGGIPLFPAIFQ